MTRTFSQRTNVRAGYAEFDGWHDALPGVPLAAMSCYGALDAPEMIPAGATRSAANGAIIGKVAPRPDVVRIFTPR
jgi:hypothetical protein